MADCGDLNKRLKELEEELARLDEIERAADRVLNGEGDERDELILQLHKLRTGKTSWPQRAINLLRPKWIAVGLLGVISVFLLPVAIDSFQRIECRWQADRIFLSLNRAKGSQGAKVANAAKLMNRNFCEGGTGVYELLELYLEPSGKP